MRICAVCKKGAMIQQSGAHQYGGGWAMRATKKRKVWNVNLHSAKVTYMGVRRTMRLCTKCLRKVKAEMELKIKKVAEVEIKKAPRVAVAQSTV